MAKHCLHGNCARRGVSGVVGRRKIPNKCLSDRSSEVVTEALGMFIPSVSDEQE